MEVARVTPFSVSEGSSPLGHNKEFDVFHILTWDSVSAISIESDAVFFITS